MSEPMSEQRERYIRDDLAAALADAPSLTRRERLAWEAVKDAMAEVDRLRAHNAMHGYAAPITFTTGEDGIPQPQWPNP